MTSFSIELGPREWPREFGLEITQNQMAQKPMLRCEVGARSLRASSHARGGHGKASAGHCTWVWAVGVVSVLCALGQIRACCCQGKFQSSPCARWVPFSAQRKRPESPYLVECAFLVLSRHRCRGEGGVLKKRSDWVGPVLRISPRVPFLSARRVPLPRGIPWVARVASPGFSSQA